jgi:hypothetical protein
LSWPQELRSSLREISKAQVAQELLRGHYLRELLTRFAAVGIRCLLIKGEALACTLYPLPGTRTRGDSDIFIAIADIAKAREAAADCGYVISSPMYKSHQFTIKGTGAGADVFEFDVHWRLLNAPRFARKISFDEGYQRSIELPGKQSARTLNTVDTLLLHCMHRSGSDWHDRNRLIWLYDIHLLLSSMTAEQQLAFVDRALQLDVQSECLDGLTKARGCYDTSIPPSLELALARSQGQRTVARRFAESNLGLLIDDWKCLQDWQARRTLLAELFFPDAESLLRKYGKESRFWLPLLYLRHGLRGISRRLTLR